MRNRRLTAAVLSLSCLFSGFGFATAKAQAEAADSEYLLQADFDNTVPEYTESVTVVPGKIEIKPSGDSDYNNVLALSKGDGENNNREGKVAATFNLGDVYMKRNSGKYQIEFDVRTDQIDQWAPYIIMAGNGFALSCIGADTSDVICSYAATRTNGWWAIYEKNVLQTVKLVPKQWVNVKIVIDTSTGNSDYYYNDIYVGSPTDSSIKNLIKGGIKQLEIQVWSHEGYDPQIYFDNFSVKKLLPAAERVFLVSASGEESDLSEEMSIVSNTIKAQLINMTSKSQLDGNISLQTGGEDVPFTYSFDSASSVCTVTVPNYLEEGREYVLNILNAEYRFKVTGYPSMLTVSGLTVQKSEIPIEDISGLNAGDVITAGVSIINTTGADKSVCLAAACYDGGKMKSLIYKTVSAAADEMTAEDTLDFTLPECENMGIRIFALDGIESFGALTDCIEIGTFEHETENIVFNLTGNAEGKTTAYVFAPGKTSQDMREETEMSGVVTYLSQQSGEWAYSVEFDDEDVSGLYKAYVNTGTAAESFRLSYVNKAENKAAAAALKSSDDFIETAKENSAALGFGEFTDTVPDKAYEILADWFKNNDVNPEDVDANRNTVRKCELLAALNEGSIDNIFDGMEYFGSDAKDIEKYYQKNYFNESMQKKITARLKTKSITSLSRLKGALNECFVLSCCEDSNGYENLTEVLLDFADEIGVNTSRINNTSANKVSGHSYLNYADLASAINALYETNNSGGGGGGGGGSSAPAHSTESSSSSGNMTILGTGNPKESPAVAIPKNIYRDIEDDYWARDAIVFATEKGIVNGKDNEQFCPQDNVKREEFVKMTALAFPAEKSGKEISFSDVENGAWYYEYIVSAVSAGIINGYDDFSFGVGRNITREEMAVILNRAAEAGRYNLAKPDVIEKFDDDADISEYAREAVYTLKNAGIINGDENKFNPKANATRAEAAMIIYNILSI